jgi:hypothetical protein
MSELNAPIPESVLPPKPRRHNEWLIIGGVVACLAIVFLVFGRGLFFGPAREGAPPDDGRGAAQASKPNTPPDLAPQLKPVQQAEPEADISPLVDDDGKTLWESPTNGRPLALGYLSPGAQIIVALRPAALLKHAEGEKIRVALGPLGKSGIEFIQAAAGMPLADMERLFVGCRITSEGTWQTTLVVRATNAITNESHLAKFAGADEKDHFGKKYWLAGERAYYLPGGKDADVLVVAPEDAIQDVIDLAGEMPPLRRDIERLINHTDGDRQLTIVFAPNSLFSEGQSMFSGQASRLREPLFWFLGDELSGAALSMAWGDDFFLELIATPTLETLPQRAATIFSERVAQVPNKLEEYVVNLNTQPYGRLVVARFPEMLRKVVAFTRSDFDKDHAVLRCYLPAVAGHNLLLAAELTLAETPRAAATDAQVSSADNTPVPVVATPMTLKDRLAKVTSLKFAKDTLETSLEQLSQDIGAPIVIRGPDLQADGITKNQSFGIDLAGKPASEILVEILRLANPDKSATAPNDKRQMLVYIIETKPDKTEQIVITTRAKAAERKDELPAPFRVEKP